MSTEFILGVAVTIALGVAAIYITLRTVKRSSLKYYQIDPGSLVSKSAKEVSDIKISYKNTEVAKDLMFFRVLLVNDGGNDIDENMIYEPLRIQFKAPFEILEAVLEKESSQTSIDCDGSSITCKWKLLKKGEYFIVRIILAYDSQTLNPVLTNADLLSKYTLLTCRITNLQRVRKDNINRSVSAKPKIGDLILYSILLLSMVGLFLRSTLQKNYELQYATNVTEGSNTYSIEPVTANSLKLSSSKTSSIRTLDEFNSTVKILNILIREKRSSADYVFFIVILVMLWQLYIVARRYRKHFRLHRLFVKSE